MVRATKAAPAFADEIDELVEELATWTADSIEEAIEAIMGSGRPIFSEDKSEREQVTEYLKLRNNPDAWKEKMAELDADLRERIGVVFEAMEVPPEFVASVHPFDIVAREVLFYSRKMERLLTEYQAKTEVKMEEDRLKLPEVLKHG
jgi:hypothetical protein